MTGVLTRRALLLAAGVIALAMRVSAVDSKRDGDAVARDAQSSPPVTLTLRIANDRRQFRPGEIIPIELIFESSIPGRFIVDGATYDRSGRLTIDEFDLAPLARVTDPMLDYFAAYGAFMGGGLRGIGALGDKPYTVRLDLNDWFRFDTPGTFTLSVRSTRVTDDAQRTPSSRAIVPVESNVVSFEIAARDTRWENAEFTRAMQLLGALNDDHMRGCRVLMFLGTHAAVDELIRRHDDGECRYQLTAGVFGARDRVYALDRLEAGLRAADQVITGDYLRTLALLAIYVRRPELRPPQRSDAKGRIVPGELARHPELVEAEERKYVSVLAAALPAKTPRARAVSTQEYTRYVSSRRGRSPAATSAAEEARRRLIATFSDLPASRQQDLLEFEWQAITDVTLLPVLRELADGTDRLADLALRRLYALAPEEGGARIIREIERPKPGASIRTLGMLPDATQPKLDEVIARQVETETTDIGLALLQRYASPVVAARMLARLGDLIGRLACTPQAYALSYFLRAAPRDGAALLERALTSRGGGTGCFQSVLLDTATLQMTPEIEAAARAHLSDPHPRVVLSAVETLGRFGSPAAIPALRVAFESWRRQWNERPNALRFSPAQGVDSSTAVHSLIEMAYVHALALGALVGGPEIADPGELCITDVCRLTVAAPATDERYTTIVVTRFDSPSDLSATLADYEFRSLTSLERKLSQYQRGVRLRMRIQIADRDEAQRIASELAAWAAANELELAP